MSRQWLHNLVFIRLFLSQKKNYKLVAIDLIKQPALHIDPREMQQIKFIGDIDRVEDATMFSIIKEAKEPI